MKNTLYSRGNPYTVVQTTDSLYSASEGEFVISSGNEVELPAPSQDSVVAVRGEPNTGVDVVPSSGQAQLNTNGISLEYGESAVFVSDGNDWYLRNDVSFYGLDIPDSEDLQAHYDFSEESVTTSNVPDLANNNDLTGSFTGFSDINGRTAGEFDGVDDGVDVSFSTVSQPNHVFVVFEFVDVTNRSYPTYFDGSSAVSHSMIANNGANAFQLNAGSGLRSSVGTDNNPHIHAGLFNGSSSVVRVDGSENSGDAGSSDLDGVTLGKRGGDSDHANVKIGEVLVYNTDKTGIVPDVESYLNDKWSVF